MAINTYRILCQIEFECDTPIKVGSGLKDIQTDSMVLFDENHLPYIPGTTISGVLRHQLNPSDADFLFGDTNYGSRLSISDAVLVLNEEQVSEGYLIEKTEMMRLYEDLPIRQHVRLGHKGAHERGGKFDEQIVFPGSRFRFEMELLADNDESMRLENLIRILLSSSLRFGGGTRRGFGKTHLIYSKMAVLNLAIPEQLEQYLGKSSSLNADWESWRRIEVTSGENDQEWMSVHCDLQPSDFFLFSSGFGDQQADITPTKEIHIQWDGDKPFIDEYWTVIPASSVKGALAHRTAYHYNRQKKVWADKLMNPEDYSGENVDAVKILFGSSGSGAEKASRGNVLISDVYLSAPTKLIQHVTIDEYTGGALDGHLFGERVSWGKDSTLSLDISLHKKAITDPEVKSAFFSALQDLCSGFLPLGGGTNRGHGVFTGEMTVETE